MALVLNDRVQQTGTANTTVSFTLSGSVTGYQSFAIIGNTNTTYYSATDTSGNWEVGLGTYSTTGPTLTRTTILASSNSGAAVTFSGTVTVFCTYPSEKSVNQDASNNVTVPAALTVTTTATANSFIPNLSTVPTNGLYLPAANNVGIATNSGERMRIDSSGNLGLGVTPSAWNSLFKAIQVGAIASFGYDNSFGQTIVTNNAYGTGSAAYTYLNATSIQAARYEQKLGTHAWFTAPSGTAGNPITFTQAMTLFASGGLSLGNTTDPGATNLSVTGTIASASTVTGTQLISNIAIGTAPLTVTSTTNVANLNASSLSGATFAAPGAIGSGTASTGAFTTLGATGAVTLSPANLAVAISPTGTGTVTINPATASTINNCSIGATTPLAGTFTALSATSNAVGSVTAKAGGLTAVTAVAGSLTLATGGVTLATQVMAAGSVWRVVAYGTYVASSSATARNLSVSCFWGATALTAVTTGAVLASTGQTTPFQVELEITGSSATAAWCTGIMTSRVTSATIPLQNIATAASVTGLTTISTLDFRVGQTGTAVAGDTINVHSVTLERIK